MIKQNIDRQWIMNVHVGSPAIHNSLKRFWQNDLRINMRQLKRYAVDAIDVDGFTYTHVRVDLFLHPEG